MTMTVSTIATELLKEHEIVRSLIHDLQRLIEEGGNRQDLDWGHHLSRELSAFRQHLQHHFDMEETNGFLTDVVVLLPQAAEQVERLRLEHQKILQSIDELVYDSNLLAHGSGVSLKALRQQVSYMLSLMQRHEAEENSLIQRAYYQEVSVVD
jgi:hemerythrin-like domain-containing protein